MEALCMAGMFLYLSFEDIRKKTIPVIPMMFWGIAGVIMHLYYGRLELISMVSGMLPGLVAYILSIVSREKIGKGDAILLIVTGVYMGFWANIMMLWTGLIIAAIAGVMMLVFFKKSRGYELPFVPFLFAGFLLVMLSNGGMPT